MTSLAIKSESSDYYSTDSDSDSEDESELDFLNRQKLDLKKKETDFTEKHGDEKGKEMFNKVYAWKINDLREKEEELKKKTQKKDELEGKIEEEA